MLSVDTVRSGYGRIEALHGVSLEVAEGEIVTLVGGNGAGKTTLMRAISGVQPVSSGSIRFKGEVIDRVDAHKRVRLGIAQVPEGRQVFAPLSVEDNLKLGAWSRRDADIAADLDGVYQTFPVLGDKRALAAGGLSGGQQQMLAISRALMSRPDLLLLDEPSLGLSPKLTQDIFSIVKRVNRERGVTMLLVEQNAAMALETADFGYILEQGRIVMEDTTARLREKDDVKEFYLGMKQAGVRGERRWKKKKMWR